MVAWMEVVGLVGEAADAKVVELEGAGQEAAAKTAVLAEELQAEAKAGVVAQVGEAATAEAPLGGMQLLGCMRTHQGPIHKGRILRCPLVRNAIRTRFLLGVDCKTMRGPRAASSCA